MVSSSQWAPTTNQMGGGYQLSKGVVDGGDAAAGQIGEVLSSIVLSPGSTITGGAVVNVLNLGLTAGDWDVQAEVWFLIGSSGAASVQANISPTSATVPAAPSIGTSRNITYATYGASMQPLLPLQPVSC